MMATPSRKLPIYGWFGVGLVVIFWALNWFLVGLRTHWGFFPLWLGYCLLVDALVFHRKGNSMLSRSPRHFILLFFISAPAWWLFELLNIRTQNWYYDGRQFFTDIQYAALASISFSTVMPAIFCTAELISTFKFLKQIRLKIKIAPTKIPEYKIILFAFICLENSFLKFLKFFADKTKLQDIP